MATQKQVVRIDRDELVELFHELRWNAAEKWSNEVLAKRIDDIPDVKPDDFEPQGEGAANAWLLIESTLDENKLLAKHKEPLIEFEVHGDVEDDDDGEEENSADEQSDADADAKPAKGKKGKRGRPRKQKPEPLTEEQIAEIKAEYASVEPAFEIVEVTPEKAEEFLRANFGNRPYRKSIAQRYAEEIVRNEWGLTLEPIIFDSNGNLASGQHRLNGLLIAEKMRKSDPERYAGYGWGEDGTVTFRTLVAYGADPEAADYHDRGQQRSGADVLFRRSEFDYLNVEEWKESDYKMLSRDLAVAARLCWIKTGQKRVSDAPHFPHSEMIDFIQTHERLKDFVAFVYNEDGKREKKISKYLSRGYMAALAYLFAASDTDSDEYAATGEFDLSLVEEAEEFVTLFARGTFEDESHPIHQLREWFSRAMAKPDKPNRDTKVDMVSKAWRFWRDGKKVQAKDMRLKKREKVSIGGIA